MFIKRSTYEVEKLKAEQRIKYLENIICPKESHDYVVVGDKTIGFDNLYGNDLTRKVYRCLRCGKLKIDM